MAITQVSFFSQSLSRQVTFKAIIPVGKFRMPGMPLPIKRPLKTLYLLHGIFGNHEDWLTGTRIASWAESRDLAVIMPSAENSFYLDNEKSGAMYGEFFGKELVEFTRDLFPLSKRREDTFIGGLSMGGYGAMRTGLKYHETFGAIAALSGALLVDRAVMSTNDTPSITGRIGLRSFYESVFGDLDKLKGSDKDPKALITSLKKNNAPIPKIYIACGTEDFLIEANRDYHKFLDETGVEHDYVEGPGAHTWDYWDEYILKVLDWLPLKDFYTVTSPKQNIYRITSSENVFCDLLVGNNKALLIDTGYGKGNLRQTVEDLIGGKPLTVVNTHSHPDHTGGNTQFDQVHINEKAYELYKESVEQSNLKIAPLNHGDIFDLGGITVRATAAPGHTSGCISLLYEEENWLYAGDATNSYCWLFLKESCGKAVYLETLDNLIELNPTKVFRSHVLEPVDTEALKLYKRAAVEADFEKGLPFNDYDTGGKEARICVLDGMTREDFHKPGFASVVIYEDF